MNEKEWRIEMIEENQRKKNNFLKCQKEYELIEARELPDIASYGYLMKHRKSKARLFLIENQDENKVFNICFRTPAPDDTGVPHILEHSVLCGSKKFPAKDPFVELVKGSLNTFLNAMTYPDHTMYPVASCNDKDFQNLMDVYMDAVLNPNIYKREEIFRQEGWSYSLEDPEKDIIYNGVVYNEMKGAFSSADDMLYREILNSLFPDTSYANESGGDPESIPDLKYEEFLEFHRKYYHPSNSYIYLYGNMDMEEKLLWLDREYLSHYDFLSVSSEIFEQKPFTQIREVEKSYSISDGENEQDNAFLSYNVVIESILKKEINLTFNILEYVLISAPGAPLKKALIDAGIGKDVYGGFQADTRQTIFSIVAKNTNIEEKERFLSIIEETLKKLVNEGIDKDALEAAINYLEFSYREADFGRSPKGLIFGIQAIGTWIYDESEPFQKLELNQLFPLMKEKINTRYFEECIQKYLLENTHASVVMIKPEKGLTAKKEKAVEEKLKAYKANLSKEEIDNLVEKTKSLAKYQETPSTKEELESIPMLKREDIDKETQKLIIEEKKIGDIKVLHHDLFTNGIGYFNFVFQVEGLELDLVPYIGLLKHVLGFVDTENYSYGSLFHEINKNTGGISVSSAVYGNCQDADKVKITMNVVGKALYEKQDFVFKMIEEILFRSKLEDTKRLYEIIAEMKSRLQMSLSYSGNVTAKMRALSYISPAQFYGDRINGVGFYKFIESLEKNFEQEKQKIVENLTRLIHFVFRKENLLLSYTADEKGYEQIEEGLKNLAEKLYSDKVEKVKEKLPLEKRNEGLKTSSQIQFVARVGNYKRAGLEYDGKLKVLSVIMDYEYLWINLRVKGGAYGCGSGFSRNGDSYFVSYRDPNLEKTNQVYNGITEYVKNFTVDERDMTKYIIGTISDLDTPLTASAKGAKALFAYLTGLTQEMLQEERKQILNATQEGIRELAPIMDAILKEQVVCALGNENKIESSSLFENKINLFE